MATLCFVVPGEPARRYTKTVEDGAETEHLANFFSSEKPYHTSWTLVDGDVWLRRDAVVSVESGASIAA